MRYLSVLLVIWSSLGWVPHASDKNIFTPNEWDKFKAERDLASRMKIYIQASNRYLSEIRQEIQSQREDVKLESSTKAFTQVIKAAAEEIAKSPDKKKSRKLKKFEISLREELASLKTLQAKAPATSHAYFSDAIEATEKVRREVLDIMFDGGATKRK